MERVLHTSGLVRPTRAVALHTQRQRPAQPRSAIGFHACRSSSGGPACNAGKPAFWGQALRATPSVRARHSRASPVTRASDDGASDVPAFKGFPPMQTRPAWYWRLAAVAPYCLPLMEGWLYSDTAITLFAPLFHYKVLCSPIVDVFAYLPSWFLLAYFFTAYLGVVRNNRWPHFLRFHVVMGMLMEIILQVVGTLNDWIPASVLWGRFGQHFWLGATLAYVFIVLECILSALRGMYADVPFISDAAYLQIPYE